MSHNGFLFYFIGKTSIGGLSYKAKKKPTQSRLQKRGKYEKIYQKYVVVFDGFMILEICEQVVSKE